MKANNYKAWDINSESFPNHGTIEDKIRFILNYGVLAPSTFNAQPWKCSIQSNKLNVYLDTNRLPKKSDKSGRFGLVSIGAFIANIEVAALHFKLKSEITFPNPKLDFTQKRVLVAIIEFKEAKFLEKDSQLFNAIINRTTNRSLSLEKKIPNSVIAEINKMETGNQEIAVIDDRYKKDLKAISHEADLEVWGDIEFRREHTDWVRNNLTKRSDGMPGSGVGVGLIPSFFAKLIILRSIFPKLQAKKNLNAIDSGQYYIAILGDDTQIEWVKIGIIFEKVSLLLTSKGIVCSPMGHFIENDKARGKLQSLLNQANKPQIFFRIGYPSAPVPHSPRISGEEIIL